VRYHGRPAFLESRPGFSIAGGSHAVETQRKEGTTVPRRKSLNLAEMSHCDVAHLLGELDVVLVPMGSIEKHGAHLPLGTDTFTTIQVVQRAAVLAGVPYAPITSVGYSPHHMGEVGRGSGTLTFSAETYRHVVYDLAKSLVYHGFNKIVFVSHHGSNSKVIDPVLRRIRYETGCFVCWYKTPTEREYSILGDIIEGPPEETPGWHAGEIETSTVLAHDESLVDMDQAVQDRTHAPPFMGDQWTPSGDWKARAPLRMPAVEMAL
jgi:creatinine amidohydrolase